jgi:outer membrane protein OmpA-like peptidoglycan-associated protein
LAAGEYSVEVTDAANQKTQAIVKVSEPAKLTGEIIEVRQATHERMADGKATAKISGGEVPYSFAWDNNESSARAVQLTVGPHSVTVTDAKGCSLILTTDIAQKILPALTAENLEKGEAVRMEKLQFQADSTDIDASSIPTLEELYAFLYDNPTIVVEIGGHTNGLPEHDYCDQLSTARAKAVADYIINKGIEPKRIVYKGYGKRQPIATNQTPEGRRKNQRVEVKIVKLSE